MPVRFGRHTLHEGEAALLLRRTGAVALIRGPARVRLCGSKLVKVKKEVAGPDEYIEVTDKTGIRITMPGPCSLFHNPIKYEKIEKHRVLCLDAGLAIVVYRPKGAPDKNTTENDEEKEKKETEKVQIAKANDIANPSSLQEVERVVIYGPSRFIPQPEEQIHRFLWRASESEEKEEKEIKTFQFYKLKVVPDSIFYRARDIHTKDNAVLTLRLVIAFELKNIEVMLDRTHDPVAEFQNGATSDVVSLCSTMTFEEFLARHHLFNSKATEIGYAINRVVFKGFSTTDLLRAATDVSVEEKTKLRVQASAEHERQKRLDFQMEKREARSRKQMSLDVEDADRRREAVERDHEQRLRQEKELCQLRLELMETEQRQALDRLQRLKVLDVDITRVLVAEQRGVSVPAEQYVTPSPKVKEPAEKENPQPPSNIAKD